MKQTKKNSISAAAESNEDMLLERSLCSATDCTGLIPALPATDSEIASYEALYHFLPKAKEKG